MREELMMKSKIAKRKINQKNQMNKVLNGLVQNNKVLNDIKESLKS